MSKAVVILLPILLCSCVALAPNDPKYAANRERIQPINYPQNTIVGTWTSMDVVPIQMSDFYMDIKVSYEFLPGGTGTLIQTTQNRANGTSLDIEADCKWRYVGPNRWMIMLPPSSEYRVLASKGMSMGTRGAVNSFASYLEDELYVEPEREVWVRSDQARVSELARRLRSQQPVFHSDANGWTLRL